MKEIIIVILILSTILYAQYAYYGYLEKRDCAKDSEKHDLEIEQLNKEFNEYKKRVDALTLKAGFRL